MRRNFISSFENAQDESEDRGYSLYNEHFQPDD